MSVWACLNCGAKRGVSCVDDRCCNRGEREDALILAHQCNIIANRVVPDGLARGCVGWKAKMWQAAWDGACIAQGGDPADFVISTKA